MFLDFVRGGFCPINPSSQYVAFLEHVAEMVCLFHSRNSISRCGCRQSSFFSTNASLALQLVWSVSDLARGIIRASGRLTAIYEGQNVAGNNTITVRDQGDNSGIAVVIH